MPDKEEYIDPIILVNKILCFINKKINLETNQVNNVKYKAQYET